MGTLNFRNIYQSAYYILTNGSIVLYEGRNSFSLTRGQFCEKKINLVLKNHFWQRNLFLEVFYNSFLSLSFFELLHHFFDLI